MSLVVSLIKLRVTEIPLIVRLIKYLLWIPILLTVVYAVNVRCESITPATISSQKLNVADLELAIKNTKPQYTETLPEAIHRLALKYKQDENLINRIIICEGRRYQNSSWNGHLNNDLYHSRDWGPMQVNDHWQKEGMKEMGFIFTNWHQTLEYGIKLLSEQGTQPWDASKSCWSK